MPPNGTLMTERPAPARSWTARSRRSLLARFSTAHGLMVLAGLLTFVLVVSATKGSDARLAVAVARDDIPAGAAVGAGLLRRVDVPADAELARSTVPWSGIGASNRVTARPIAAGEFLRPSDLVAPAGSGRAQPRAMSIPVKPERAVGGTLHVGDRVDVVDVVDGVPRWVVTGAQVIEVPEAPSARGIVRDVGAAYHVVVEVDAVQALALAQALSHDSISVVRSTGAPPPPPVFSGLSAPPGPSPATPSTQPAGGQTPAPAPGS